MKRRNFLTNFSLGWTTTWLGAMLAAFYNGIIGRQSSGAANASTPTPTAKSTTMATPTPKSTAMATPTSKPSMSSFVKAGTVKDLDQKGSLALKGSKEAAVIVRDPKNAKTLYAVNSTCTHKGCTVKWETQSKEMVCPCHSSAFKPDGSVAKGPASKPLKRYEAKIEGADVLIKWS